MDEVKEQWMHRIRSLAPQLQQAENDVFVAEANLKRLLAQLKLKATAEGCRTVAAQEVYAENSQDVYDARIEIGRCKGLLMGLKVQLKSLEVGFEEWRTKMVNYREEKKRYGT
jgi:gluconate kinase